MVSTTILNLAGDLIGGKWRLAIIYVLQNRPLRFSEIKEYVPGCSVKVLSSVLKEMTENNLLIREQYHTIPVKVTYRLNPDVALLMEDFNQLYKAWCYYVVNNAKLLHISPELIDQILKELQ
jgi:DNA-binding HxlR family transcriptional regulator